MTGQCERHGSYIGTSCPVCDGLRRSAGRRWHHKEEIERALQERCPSGPFNLEEDPDE